MNKSAREIGKIQFTNGNRLTLFVDHNSNTGEVYAYQQLDGKRPSKVSGRNLKPFLAELDEVMNENEATWVGGRPTDHTALDALTAAAFSG